MSQHSMADPAAWARAIIDSSSYMVLGTADDSGLPWATPVWFAHVAHSEFIWVSRTDVRHSQNIALRPQISIVIFDSSVPIGTGQGVYMRATAGLVANEELDRALAVFSTRSVAQGGRSFGRELVEGDSVMRLFRATASEHSMLAKDGQADHRIAVDLAAAT